MGSILLQNAVRELSQGWEWAKQLRSIIDEPFGNDRSVESDHLIRKILSSFTDTISILNSCQVSDRIPPDTGLQLGDCQLSYQVPQNTGLKMGDSGRTGTHSSALKRGTVFSNKRRTPYPALNVRSAITTDLPDEDGYEWRKYGQKDILGAKYPRSLYSSSYRCSFWDDNIGCQAKKHVRRIGGDPPKYETTYLGDHTCRNRLEEALLENSTTLANSNSPHFRMDSSNSSQVNNDPSYPNSTSTSTKTKTNKPPLIIFSYLT